MLLYSLLSLFVLTALPPAAEGWSTREGTTNEAWGAAQSPLRANCQSPDSSMPVRKPA